MTSPIVSPWGRPSDNPLYAAGREVLEQATAVHAKQPGVAPAGIPEIGTMPGLESTPTDGLSKAASTITLRHRIFNMQDPQAVLEYEEILTKAMNDRQLLEEFRVDGKLLPEMEYTSVIEESATWTKEADYFVAVKYCVIKVTHRLVNKTDA